MVKANFSVFLIVALAIGVFCQSESFLDKESDSDGDSVDNKRLKESSENLLKKLIHSLNENFIKKEFNAIIKILKDKPNSDSEKVSKSFEKLSKESLEKVSKASEDFNNRLLAKLIEKQKNADVNIFVSPLSLSMVLLMAMAGSGGQTYEEIHKTLG